MAAPPHLHADVCRHAGLVLAQVVDVVVGTGVGVEDERTQEADGGIFKLKNRYYLIFYWC